MQRWVGEGVISQRISSGSEGKVSAVGGRDVCVGGAGSSSGGKGGEEAAGWDRKPVARGEGVWEGKGPAMDGVGTMQTGNP